MNLNQKIKAIRLSEGLSREELSQLVDIPQFTIRNYEQGVRGVKGETLKKILSHSKFKKYTYWLMTDEVLPESGQISPDFSIIFQLGVVEKKESAEKIA